MKPDAFRFRGVQQEFINSVSSSCCFSLRLLPARSHVTRFVCCFTRSKRARLLRFWLDLRCEPSFSYLMQLSGSRRQSVLHMNLSQCNQPMVGVRARPLSRASAAGTVKNTRRNREMYILALKRVTFYASGDNGQLDSVVCVYFPVFIEPPPPVNDADVNQ